MSVEKRHPPEKSGDNPYRSHDENIEYFRERPAPFKAPRKIAFPDALPGSAVGKILRRELRALEAKA